MQLDLYQVDAFADRPFAGNPAAVCPLPEGEPWPDDAHLQAIALENNLSETAFFAPEADGYRLRWFTPTMEVDLCGHATLASAWTMFNMLGHAGDAIRFHTRSGPLIVRRDGDRLAMDFPKTDAKPMTQPPGALAAALGKAPCAVLTSAASHYMAVFPRSADVRDLAPDFSALGALDRRAVIATAPGEDMGYDFVSRMFAPGAGINEDPVTGSAHCVLAPYWAGRLGKKALSARQISARGGDVDCVVDGDRVHLFGKAALYMVGKIDTTVKGAAA